MKDKIGLKPIDIDVLKRLAIFVKKIKVSKGGNLNPIGTITISELWRVIEHIELCQGYNKGE